MEELRIENLKPISIEEAFAVYDEEPSGEPETRPMSAEEAAELLEALE